MNESIDNNCACEHARGSYAQIMDDMELEEEVKPICWEFIRHCQLNGHTLTDHKLTDILIAMDIELHYTSKQKIDALRKAINGGYYDIRRG